MGAAFEQVIRLQFAKFSPAEAQKRHVAVARAGLAQFMAGQATKPTYTIEVDGHGAASETAVRPFGVIAYRFTRLREVAAFALAEAQRLSPSRSGGGLYKRSWFLTADGVEVLPEAVPPGARQVVLINDAPYARKIQTRGARLLNVPPGIVERVRQSVQRRYGAIADVKMSFVTLAGGHTLKRSGKGRGARAGTQLSYPALVITVKH